MEKSPEAFRTISEVAEDLDVPQHVLRFWEGKFSHVKPMKRGGGRRYYRPQDVELLRGIRELLYGQGYTIRGVQKILRENGVRYVVAIGAGEPISPELTVSMSSGANPETMPVELNETELKAAAEAAGLSREQVRLLQATLFELTELKRILDEPGEEIEE